MDEIVRAAGFSRQGLYLYYARKRTCFAQRFSARSQRDLMLVQLPRPTFIGVG
jgi:hypothetical protein